jgi:hypothetical protein
VGSGVLDGQQIRSVNANAGAARQRPKLHIVTCLLMAARTDEKYERPLPITKRPRFTSTESITESRPTRALHAACGSGRLTVTKCGAGVGGVSESA